MNGTGTTRLCDNKSLHLKICSVQRSLSPFFAGTAAAAAAAATGGPTTFPGLGGPLRHPLFPGATGALDPAALSIMNEEMLAQWRRSLEQGPLGGLGLPGAPLTPPTSLGVPVSASSAGRKSPPLSPGPGALLPDQDGPPSNGRSGSPPAPDENSNVSRATPASMTNGGDGSGKAQSEGDTGSPLRADSKSPPAGPKMEDSPPSSLGMTQFPTSLNTPTPSQLTASIASHFPNPLNNPMSLPLPLSVPPLMSTSRIPKSDPMEGKLQDMLR